LLSVVATPGDGRRRLAIGAFIKSGQKSLGCQSVETFLDILEPCVLLAESHAQAAADPRVQLT
jgi:hypothetical protein